MRGNLSIIFGRYISFRCDLMKDVDLQDIDFYTTSVLNSDEVRRDFQEDIDYFRQEHQEELSKLSSSKGQVVIVYPDEKNPKSFHRLRVLYKKDEQKRDASFVFKQDMRLLSKKNPEVTLDVLSHLSDLFDSEFFRDTLRNAKYQMQTDRERILFNQKLVHRIIGDTCRNREENDFSNFYYTIRRLDSYLERQLGFQTTPPIVPSSKEKIQNLVVQEKALEEGEKQLQKSSDTKQAQFLTPEEFLARKAEEAMRKGETYSLPDLDLEYRELVKRYPKGE